MGQRKKLGDDLKFIFDQELERNRKNAEEKVKPKFNKIIDGLEDKLWQNAKNGQYCILTITTGDDMNEYYKGGLERLLKKWAADRGLRVKDIPYPRNPGINAKGGGDKIEIYISWR